MSGDTSWSRILQSWTKMLRKIDVAMSSFKIKPLKALASKNTPPSPPPKKAILNYRLFLTANEQHCPGWGEGWGHCGKKSAGWIGVLWIRKCTILNNLFVQDFGFHAVDSRFQALDSWFYVSGTWIPDSNRSLNSGFLELYSGFQSPGNFPDFRFQKKKFPGILIRIPLTNPRSGWIYWVKRKSETEEDVGRAAQTRTVHTESFTS